MTDTRRSVVLGPAVTVPEIDFADMTPDEYLAWVGPAVTVENGWRWLTANFPGWQRRIDIETLDLAYGSRCICGQLFAEEALEENRSDGYVWALSSLFDEGTRWLRTLFPELDEEVELDEEEFAALLGFSIEGTYYGYFPLREAWVRRLRAYAAEQAAK